MRAVVADGGVDLRGPAVHGRKGERFLYLTWGDVGADDSFAMFRRAKLMIAGHRSGDAECSSVLVARFGSWLPNSGFRTTPRRCRSRYFDNAARSDWRSEAVVASTAEGS